MWGKKKEEIKMIAQNKSDDQIREKKKPHLFSSLMSVIGLEKPDWEKEKISVNQRECGWLQSYPESGCGATSW